MNLPKIFTVVFWAPLLALADASEIPRQIDPPPVKGSVSEGEGIVSSVYYAEIEGAIFRAYVVKWNGVEIIVNEARVQLSAAHKIYSVGERISFNITRVAPQREGMVTTLSFSVTPASKTVMGQLID